MDVVHADRARWTADPFGAAIDDTGIAIEPLQPVLTASAILYAIVKETAAR